MTDALNDATRAATASEAAAVASEAAVVVATADAARARSQAARRGDALEQARLPPQLPLSCLRYHGVAWLLLRLPPPATARS